jgi:hypothetical protein
VGGNGRVGLRNERWGFEMDGGGLKRAVGVETGSCIVLGPKRRVVWARCVDRVVMVEGGRAVSSWLVGVQKWAVGVVGASGR